MKVYALGIDLAKNGLLLDRGIAIGAAATRSCRLIPKIVCEPNEVLTELIREITGSLYAFMLQIDQRIRALLDQRLRPQ